MLSKAVAVFGLVPSRRLTRWLGVSAVLLAILGLAWPASAQYQERPNYLRIGAGIAGLMSDDTVFVTRPDFTVIASSSYNAGYIISGTYGRFVHPKVVIEAEIGILKNGINEFIIDNGIVSDQDYTAVNFTGNVLYHFKPPGEFWTPYVGGGFVFTLASLDVAAPLIASTLDGSGVGFQVRGGILTPIRDGWHWNIEGRFIMTQELTLDNASASALIDYRSLGGTFYLGYSF